MRLAAAGALLLLLTLAPWLAPGALGHAELVASTPAANDALTEAPEAVVLTFSEPVDEASIRIRVLDARGQPVSDIGDTSLDAAATTATAALPTLDAGVYTVDYQVTSAVDGHVTSGLFAFLVDPTGTQPAPSLPSEAESLSSPVEAIVARWVALAAALAAAGTLIFWVASARPALRGARAPERAPWAAVAVIALVAVTALAAHSMIASRPILAADPTAAGLALDPLAPFGWTPFAVAMRVALAGLLATLVVALARLLLPLAEGPAIVAALAAAIVALGGMSFAGHPAASGGPAFAALDLVHLVGVATWLGTLVGLLLLAVRHRPAMATGLRRHSRVALVAAPVVVLTGLANSPLVLGDDARELVGSAYGNLLLAKGILFSVAVAIGAANFFLIRDRGGRRHPLLLVGLELGVAAVAVLVAAGMVTGQPSAGRVPLLVGNAIGTAHLYGTAGDASVHAAISLPAPGEQRYQVAISDVATGVYREDVQRVFLVLTPPPESGLTAERVALDPGAEPGIWGTSGAYTPVIGDWQVEVIVRVAGELDAAVAFPLAVREPVPPQPVPPPDTGIGVPLPLAALWRVLPAGVAGWAIVGALLIVAAGLFAVGRRRRTGSWARARLALVAVIVVVGLGVGSRELVAASNRPPPEVARRTNPVPATEESVDRGRNLYLANCSACHGTDGSGNGPLAGAFSAPRPLADSLDALTDGEVAHRIAAGTAGTRMPAFAGILSEDDRWDLVNYLRSRWPR